MDKVVPYSMCFKWEFRVVGAPIALDVCDDTHET